MTKPELDLFGSSSQLPEVQTDEAARASLERFVRTIIPALYNDELEEQFGREGVQYILMGPAPGITQNEPILDLSPDSETGRLNQFTQGKFTPEGKYIEGVRIPQLGLFNVTRTLNSHEIEYHPLDEDKSRFTLKLGDKLDISGDVDPRTLVQVFPRLFQGGQRVFDISTYHFANQVRSLWYYGRDGRPRQPRTRQLPQ